MPANSRRLLPSSLTTPPPSPIPTGKGSRSAAGPVLSDYVDNSIRVPELTLPQHVRRHKLEEISYSSLLSRENDTVRRLKRLAREYGVFRIRDHGISTEELRLTLANSDRIFGLTVECLTSYGDHERLVWRGDDQEIMEKANTVIGYYNFQVLWKIMENVAGKLEEIAEGLAQVMDENDTKQSRVRIRLEEPTLSIYRYHRANIIDRISSVTEKTNQESGPYALSLHALLQSGEFCVQTESGKLIFGSNADAIVVTMGKQIEVSQQWSHGRFNSVNGEILFNPYLHSNIPSFSIEQKWPSSSSRDINKTISVAEQIMILLILAMFYRSFVYLYS